MKQYGIKDIKNIALAGHAGAGKTSLAEALIFKAGASDRLGKIADGNTICDFDSEEIKRKATLNLSLAAFEYSGKKINLLDAPGLFDFAGGMYEAVAAADTVMIAVSSKSGVQVGTEKAFELAKELKKPTAFAVTKLDEQEADFYGVLERLKETFGNSVCPLIVPVVKDRKVVSYVNLLEMKAYSYDAKGNAKETEMPDGELADKSGVDVEYLIAAMSEAVAETDEVLMDKFFAGEAFTQDELIDGIQMGMTQGIITPVACCSSFNLSGIDLFLKNMLFLPSADSNPAETEGGEVAYDEKASVSAFVFKTVADPFVGRMSFIKVVGGSLKPNSEYINANTGNPEKIGKIFTLCGKKQLDVTAASAGDIVVAVKIDANTSDSICQAGKTKIFKPVKFPRPCYGMAVAAKAQGDESKISTGMQRLCEEDKTLSFGMNSVTKEQILKGLGEQHLEVAVAKLKTKFGADVSLSIPKIAYRETIRRKIEGVHGKHKKQTGGSGQYGHVVMNFEPCDSETLVFEEKVFGGSVPRNFFPAVEKGLLDSMKKGVLAGCPVTGLKATLTDGSYHAVDSSEIAFKLAAGIAYREGLKKADPAILEPIGKLFVTTSDSHTGDIMGDLNKRRGRVLGMNAVRAGYTEIEAEVPMREMQSFTMNLRQITRGRGSFVLDELRYEQLPHNLVAEVVASIGESE
ncbi:MAG: elongation factor G [Oscillospiraceae bacterium]|nr:elongation factor G [Oscillospiraceae bacterium]